MSVGTFTLIRNEASWIGPHIEQLLPFVDKMVFYDGNSTDGTLEIIKDFIKKDYNGHKIVLKEDKDPKDLKGDYVRLFDECLHELDTEFGMYVHPDMWAINPVVLKDLGTFNDHKDAQAFTTRMHSFAGDPGGKVFKFVSGRAKTWKNIFRLKNPDMDAHYVGAYGAPEEDVYFKAITGDEYHYRGENYSLYPYKVTDSWLEVLHFSDVRPYERRLQRMIECMRNQGRDEEWINRNAFTHPRVSLQDGGKFQLRPIEELPDYQHYLKFKKQSQTYGMERNNA